MMDNDSGADAPGIEDRRSGMMTAESAAGSCSDPMSGPKEEPGNC